MAKKPPKTLWVCREITMDGDADFGEMYTLSPKKSDACEKSCPGFAEGCRPVRYRRDD